MERESEQRVESIAHAAESNVSAAPSKACDQGTLTANTAPTTKGCSSSMTGFVALVGLVDHVDPALPAHQLVVAVAFAQQFQRITDFHDGSGCSRAAGRGLGFVLSGRYLSGRRRRVNCAISGSLALPWPFIRPGAGVLHATAPSTAGGPFITVPGRSTRTPPPTPFLRPHLSSSALPTDPQQT